MEKIIFLLLFMFVFYALPEILRSLKKKEYEYPEIPSRVPPAENKPMVTQGKLKPAIAEQNAPTVTSVTTVTMPEAKVFTPMVSETTVWQQLDQSTIMNGIIFAEILKPPLARRPFRPNRLNH